jgi:hypothetical protein
MEFGLVTGQLALQPAIYRLKRRIPDRTPPIFDDRDRTAPSNGVNEPKGGVTPSEATE